MKKLTRERVVPTISASVSWLIFASTGSGLLPVPGGFTYATSCDFAEPHKVCHPENATVTSSTMGGERLRGAMSHIANC